MEREEVTNLFGEIVLLSYPSFDFFFFLKGWWLVEKWCNVWLCFFAFLCEFCVVFCLEKIQSLYCLLLSKFFLSVAVSKFFSSSNFCPFVQYIFIWIKQLSKYFWFGNWFGDFLSFKSDYDIMMICSIFGIESVIVIFWDSDSFLWWTWTCSEIFYVKDFLSLDILLLGLWLICMRPFLAQADFCPHP